MADAIKKNRIWELDFFRGICILGVIIVHLFYDLVFFAEMSFDFPTIFIIIADYGGILFIILSGICITLGSHCIKRGLIVFGAGMLISAVTFVMFGATSDMIWFGVLHLLGVCMLLYPLLKKLPSPVLIVVGIVFIALGLWFRNLIIDSVWLFPLGLRNAAFGSSDYFPLFPNLGYFMVGIALGRLVYGNRTSLFPNVNCKNPLIRFFSFCGRHSLWIYLGHQPIIYGTLHLILGIF